MDLPELFKGVTAERENVPNSLKRKATLPHCWGPSTRAFALARDDSHESRAQPTSS